MQRATQPYGAPPEQPGGRPRTVVGLAYGAGMTWQALAAADPDTGSALVVAGTGVVAALLGAGWIGTVLKLRAERRKGLAVDVRAAQDAVQRLRSDLRTRLRTPGAVSDSELEDRLADLDTAVHRTGCESVVEAARHYAEVGQAYASGDPDTSVTAEQTAYDRVAEALMVELRRNR